MAPTALSQELDQRYATYCNNGQYWDGYRCRSNSSWSYWGRWVLAGIVILVFIISLSLLARISSRRRRNRGQPPRYGTGWLAPGVKYDNNPNAYQPPPPQYSAGTSGPGYNPQQPQYTGQTFNSNDGYYGSGQTEGVAPPQNTYYPQGARGGDDVYAPPPGPPPGK